MGAGTARGESGSCAEYEGVEHTMNPNLTPYYWAEQINRERRESEATTRWLTAEATSGRPRFFTLATLCAAAEAGLDWLGSHAPAGLARQRELRLVMPSGARS